MQGHTAIKFTDYNSAEMLPFPQVRPTIIYADPAWPYKNEKTGGSMKSGAKHIYGAVGKYPVMSIEEICSLPVNEISAKDAVLFLWATVPLLPDAFTVLTAWGFEYKTLITWHKKQKKHGMGAWLRVQTELLLVGVRGNVQAFHSHNRNIVITSEDDPEVECLEDVGSTSEALLVEVPVTEHSAKPKLFYRLIDDLTKRMPERTKLELFARGVPVAGWNAWGNEVERNIQPIDAFPMQ